MHGAGSLGSVSYTCPSGFDDSQQKLTIEFGHESETCKRCYWGRRLQMATARAAQVQRPCSYHAPGKWRHLSI